MHDSTEMSFEEMNAQKAVELPGRELLLGVSVLGIPLAGLDGVTVNVNTAGPGWLIHG